MAISPESTLEVIPFATKRQGYQITDENDAAIDITGGDAAMEIRDHGDSPEARITLTVGSGITFTTPLNGELEVVLSNTQTSQLRGGSVYSLLVKLPSGDVFEADSGSVVLKKANTRVLL